MNRVVFSANLLLPIVLALPSLASGQGRLNDSSEINKSMSTKSALRQIAAVMENCDDCELDGPGKEYGAFTQDGYTYTSGTRVIRHFYGDMRYVSEPKRHAGGEWCVDRLRSWSERPPCWRGSEAQTNAERFVSGLNRMIWEYTPEGKSHTAAEHEALEASLGGWRALPVKPTMPEDARAHRVLAENAVQEKNLSKAIDEYEAALEIFPTWPDGQFNVALICGENGNYDCAVEHMQNYLELVPDAPDAQAAKDKIIIWKEKVRTDGRQAEGGKLEQEARTK